MLNNLVTMHLHIYRIQTTLVSKIGLRRLDISKCLRTPLLFRGLDEINTLATWPTRFIQKFELVTSR